MKYIRKEEGFNDQELYVIPPDVTKSRSQPVIVRNLMVSDAGYFPKAAGHQKSRNPGIDEGILLFCTAGTGFVKITDKPTVFLKQNQAYYIQPGTTHIYGASDKDPWSLYWMHMRGELLDSYSSVLQGYADAIPLCSRTVEQVGRMFPYLLESMSEGYSVDAMIKSSQLASAVFTTVLYGNRDFNRDVSRSNLKRIDRIVDRMRLSLEEEINLSLEDMAAFLGLSIPHFSDVFKKAKGYSPIEYYTRMKIQKACRLLEMSDMEVQDIAIRTSYADRYYFSRVFKKIMGVSPSKYREQLNQNHELKEFI